MKQQSKIKERNNSTFSNLIEQLIPPAKKIIKYIIVYIESHQLESPAYTVVTGSVLGAILKFHM